MVQFDSWLLFAAFTLSSLSVVLASPIHQDFSLMDLQRREVLERAVGPVAPIALGDDHPPPIPPNEDDKETPLGDGSDLYRSKKEDPDDPPTDDPADYPLKRSDRATEYNHDPEDQGPPEVIDPKKPAVQKKGTALRDITVHVLVKGKMKWLRTKRAWPVDPHRFSYYRAFKNDLVYFRLGQGKDAEVDTKDLKMEIDHNVEHQEPIKFIFSKNAPVPEGVDEKLWRSWADQYTDDGENTDLKVALAQVLNHPDNANNLDGVINQMKGDLTTSVINKLLTNKPAGGPKYHATRSRSALWGTARFLKLQRTEKMYEKFTSLFADTFEAHTKKENEQAAKKAAKHIKERFGILRSALIKRAFDDLKEAKPDSWDPKKKTTYQAEFLDEDVPNRKQWDGTDGSELEEKKKTCESGMYSTSEACGKECVGGKCESGASGYYNNIPYSYCRC